MLSHVRLVVSVAGGDCNGVGNVVAIPGNKWCGDTDNSGSASSRVSVEQSCVSFVASAFKSDASMSSSPVDGSGIDTGDDGGDCSIVTLSKRVVLSRHSGAIFIYCAPFPHAIIRLSHTQTQNPLKLLFLFAFW